MTPRVQVKICGLTRVEDALEAARLGASYLGVIFAGGPRLIDATRARSIVEAVAPVPVIGVFGAQDRDEIFRLRDATGIRGAQLHGGGSVAVEEELARQGLQVIRVVHLASPRDLASLAVPLAASSAFLVEPRVPGRLGGSGVALPLELAVAAREQLAGRRMFLAGGLTPQNVAAAVAQVRPDAVDVSSGVEQIPGIKDSGSMARFMEQLAWA